MLGSAELRHCFAVEGLRDVELAGLMQRGAQVVHRHCMHLRVDRGGSFFRVRLQTCDKVDVLLDRSLKAPCLVQHNGLLHHLLELASLRLNDGLPQLNLLPH